MARRNRRRKSDLSLNQIPFLLVLCFLLVLAGCNSGEKTSNVKPQIIKLSGNTQGTTYSIICTDTIDITSEEIDETLRQFDLALSTYIPESIISKLNDAPVGKFEYQDIYNYFNNCVYVSKEVFKLTNGAFDPTVYPLLDAWGFFKDVEFIPDTNTIDSILTSVGFDDDIHFSFDDLSPKRTSAVIKNTPGSKLVFNAIAQGQAVDVLCHLLEWKGAKNYFVEIGGEIRVKGKNPDQKLWTIGIDEPIENSTASNREIMKIIQLDNKAVATSGSYRKFYERDGRKYSHTINPKTGYPVQHQLLSVTVVSDNCAMADGLATAFMVMGTDNVIQFLKDGSVPGVDVFLVYNNSKNRLETFMTNGFKTLILE